MTTVAGRRAAEAIFSDFGRRERLRRSRLQHRALCQLRRDLAHCRHPWAQAEARSLRAQAESRAIHMRRARSGRALAVASAPGLVPGPQWDGTAGSGGQPTVDQTLQGSGFEQMVIGNFDWPIENTYITADLTVTVLGEHGDTSWIKNVQFFFEGNSQTVSQITLSGSTNAIGWATTISFASMLPDSEAFLYAVITPWNGYKRLIGPMRITRMDSRPQRYINFATGSDSTGDGLTPGTAWKTFDKGMRAAPDGAIIEAAVGVYTEAATGTATVRARAIEFRRPAGTNLGDVVIQQAARGAWSLNSSRVIFNGIKVDTDNIQRINGRPPPAYYTWQGCLITDSFNGHGPQPYGYYTGTVGSMQHFFNNTVSTTGYHALIDTTVVNPPTAGATFIRGSLLKTGWDATAIGATQQGYVCFDTVQLKTGALIQRYHLDNTVTVASVTFDGTNSTITWSGTPGGMSTIGNNTDTSARVRFQTGTAADTGDSLDAQGFQLISQGSSDGVTWTSVVKGNATAAVAGDTAVVAVLAHSDSGQFTQLPATASPFDNAIFQRVLSDSDPSDDPINGGFQPMLPQPGVQAGAGTMSTVGTAFTCTQAHNLVVGDYVRLPGNTGVGRRVVEVDSTTTAVLKDPFPTDQTNVTWRKVKTLQNIGWQLCIFGTIRTTINPNAGGSQFTQGIRHYVMRQCTHHAANLTLRTDSDIVCEDVVFTDSIWFAMNENPMPSEGTRIDNNHFESATGRGTNFDVGPVTYDANYKPTGVTRTIASPKLPWDYHLQPLHMDGTDLVGAVKAP